MVKLPPTASCSGPWISFSVWTPQHEGVLWQDPFLSSSRRGVLVQHTALWRPMAAKIFVHLSSLEFSTTPKPFCTVNCGYECRIVSCYISKYTMYNTSTYFTTHWYCLVGSPVNNLQLGDSPPLEELWCQRDQGLVAVLQAFAAVRHFNFRQLFSATIKLFWRAQIFEWIRSQRPDHFAHPVVRPVLWTDHDCGCCQVGAL